jgi:hypothetical protein
MAGAFAYAFSPFVFQRADRQLALSLYAHLPLLGLVLAWAFARRGPGLLVGRRMAIAIAVAVVAVIGNFYYAALFVQFLILAALAQALRRRGALAVQRPSSLRWSWPGSCSERTSTTSAIAWGTAPTPWP